MHPSCAFFSVEPIRLLNQSLMPRLLFALVTLLVLSNYQVTDRTIVAPQQPETQISSQVLSFGTQTRFTAALSTKTSSLQSNFTAASQLEQDASTALAENKAANDGD